MIWLMIWPAHEYSCASQVTREISRNLTRAKLFAATLDMSAITGILRLDGQDASREEIENVTRVLKHRGRDDSDVWREGAVGLGHRMMWTTPESLHEKLPRADESNSFVLTADARIDNRDELRPLLGLNDVEVSDSEFILRAYAKWGEACPEHLLGDFAFALWDKKQKKLFCARDHFGVKPFYYHHAPKEFFAFATEIKALWELPVSREIDEAWVGEYLAPMPYDATITAYRDVRRLPPAHALTLDDAGMRLRPYWALDAKRELRLGSDGEYAERFRELFTEAVSCRLRSVFPVAAMLSGGLDSSSVACVAEKILDESNPLLTFSNVFDEVPKCDERPFIEAVLSQGNYKSHYLQADRIGALSNADEITLFHDEAWAGPGVFAFFELGKAVQAQGARVLLDGHGGDEVVSQGYLRVKELARRNKWMTLSRELKGVSKIYGESLSKLLWLCVRNYKIVPLISGDKWFIKGLRLVWRTARGRRRTKPVAVTEWHDLLNADFVRRSKLEDRFAASQESDPWRAQTERESQYRILNQAAQPAAFEEAAQSCGGLNLELRYPFYDKRLVEFCLSLPSDQKLCGGWPRIILRRAMKGILPEQVRWRTDKTDFLPNTSRALLKLDAERLKKVVSGFEAIDGYVNIDFIRNIYQRLSSDAPARPQEVLMLWRVVTFSLWLRSVEKLSIQKKDLKADAKDL